MYQTSDKCIGCTVCISDCPAGAISMDGRKAVINSLCVECGVCLRVCPAGAIEQSQTQDNSLVCSSCPIQCRIAPGLSGACKRYINDGTALVRGRPPVFDTEISQNTPSAVITTPLMTAVGAGTNYPCSRPAPFIVSQCRDGIDVVTVVTEAPLSYSSVILKIDTNAYLGEEGDRVYRGRTQVGMVNPEEYGSKMISVGGANQLTGKKGFTVARTITELANGEAVELTVGKEKKTKITVQAGKAPFIGGVEERKMRIGCGSATIGLFAAKMKEAVDECIVLDHHVIGLLTEHLAGEAVGLSWSGVVPNARKSSRGRYFGDHGDGIGGTSLETPAQAIGSVDMSIAREGQTILVINTTGEIFALFRINKDGTVTEIEADRAVLALVRDIQSNCEDALVSVLYNGGTGGSARGGVCRAPLALSKAVHSGKAALSIGGAPAFVYPGGGINFLVDTGKVVNKAFTWVPTPATVAPVEYTMERSDYEKMEGHMDSIRPVDEVKKEWES